MQEVLIRDVFGLKNTSLQIKLDILDVLLNYRKGARILCRVENQIEEILETLINCKIGIAIGKGMVLQGHSSPNNVQDYFDSDVKDVEKLVPIYLSQTEVKAKKLRSLDESKNDFDFGLALDYPKCCIEKVKIAGHVPTIVEAFENLLIDGKYNVWTWPIAMIRDSSLLVHFPCSTNCIESEKLAKKHFSLIKKYGSEDIYNRVTKHHTCTYSLKNNVILIDDNDNMVRPLNFIDDDLF